MFRLFVVFLDWHITLMSNFHRLVFTRRTISNSLESGSGPLILLGKTVSSSVWLRCCQTPGWLTKFGVFGFHTFPRYLQYVLKIQSVFIMLQCEWQSCMFIVGSVFNVVNVVVFAVWQVVGAEIGLPLQHEGVHVEMSFCFVIKLTDMGLQYSRVRRC